MKTTNNIPESLIEDIKSDITYKKSVSAIGKGICYIAIGIVAIVLLIIIGTDSAAWETWGLGCIGTILIVMGIMSICGSKPDLYYKNEKVIGYQAFFSNPSTSAISKFIDEENSEALGKAINIHDNGLRVNMVMTENGNLCRYRMYKYVPFEYKPEGEIVEIEKKKGDTFGRL